MSQGFENEGCEGGVLALLGAGGDDECTRWETTEGSTIPVAGDETPHTQRTYNLVYMSTCGVHDAPLAELLRMRPCAGITHNRYGVTGWVGVGVGCAAGPDGCRCP